MTIEVVDTHEGLAAHADAWNNLALEAPQRLPELSHAWVSSYLECCLTREESWFCVFVWNGATLVGVLPVVTTQRRFAMVNWSLLRAPQDDHTSFGDCLVAEGYGLDVVMSLVGTALSRCRSPFSLRFPHLASSSPTLALATHSRGGLCCALESRGLGSFLNTTGRFEDYRDTLSKNFKGNLRKARNHLKTLPGVSFEVIRNDAAVGSSLDRFMRVEESGWKGQAGTAIRSSSTLVSFYELLTQRLSRAGWLHWSFLHGGGRTLAASLSVAFSGSLVMCKVGYDEEYSQCAPGSMLLERVLEEAFSDPATDEVNLLSNTPWHDNWRCEKRPYYALFVFPTGVVPFVFGYAPKLLVNTMKKRPFAVKCFRAFRRGLLRMRSGKRAASRE